MVRIRAADGRGPRTRGESFSILRKQKKKKKKEQKQKPKQKKKQKQKVESGDWKVESGK
jgi:hypothetical protein